MNMINIAILLSANLGVMNLLPIPALDGGRLLFFLIEAVSLFERGYAVGVVAVVIVKLGDYHLSALVRELDGAILFVHPALNDNVVGHHAAVEALVPDYSRLAMLFE